MNTTQGLSIRNTGVRRSQAGRQKTSLVVPLSTYSSIGSRRSHLYQVPDCRSHGQIAPRNRVEFIARKKRKRSHGQSTVPVNLLAHAPLHSETDPPGCVNLISAGASPYRCSQFSHRCGGPEKFLFGSCLWQID